MATNPKQFFEYAKKHKAEMVDLKFMDLLGTWQHCSYPIDTWDEDTFEEGVGFDGSSIRGWQGIHMSDMLAIPDAATALSVGRTTVYELMRSGQLDTRKMGRRRLITADSLRRPANSARGSASGASPGAIASASASSTRRLTAIDSA